MPDTVMNSRGAKPIPTAPTAATAQIQPSQKYFHLPAYPFPAEAEDGG